MKIHTAIIGCGGVVSSYGGSIKTGTLNHLSTIANNKNYEVIAVSDTDSDKLNKIREKFNIKNIYQSYTELISSHSLDLVIVAVPTELHFEVVKYLIDKNIKNIFCEKPFTSSYEEALALRKLIKDQNVFVNYFRRWNSDIESEIQKIKDNKYGKLIKGNCLYTKDLHTNASHIVHLLNWMFGYPEKITTHNIEKKHNQIFSDFALTFQEAPINISSIQDVDYVLIEIDLIFSNGRFKITQRGQKIVIGEIEKDVNYGFKVISEKEINTNWDHCFSNAYKSIQDCIIGKNVNKCDINIAVEVHKILDEIKK